MNGFHIFVGMLLRAWYIIWWSWHLKDCW